jgi:serine/threonine protein kinase
MPPLDDGEELVGAVLRQRWRIRRLIGTGGLGLVYEVEDSRQPASYAVKLLRPEFCEEPSVVARFLAEVQATGRIDHPGIPRVVECDRAEDGTPYIVMELLSGESLSEVMNRGRVPVSEAARIATGILETLTAAHAVGVVHRDLKPDNVFLTTRAEDTAVKVLDFGLARVMDAAGGPSRKTRTGMMLGTPGYMSPEQVKNAKEAGVPADLWSVGVILYEMLTGVRAFAATNEFERMTKVLTERPTPIQDVAPQYAHWAQFFAGALAFEPAARFQTGPEMLTALVEVAKGSTMSMPPPGSAETLTGPPPPLEVRVARPSVMENAGRIGRGQFGGVDTAVSAGTTAGLEDRLPPSSDAIKVVQLPPRGVPVWLTVALTIAALCFGLLAGFLLGTR